MKKNEIEKVDVVVVSLGNPVITIIDGKRYMDLSYDTAPGYRIYASIKREGASTWEQSTTIEGAIQLMRRTLKSRNMEIGNILYKESMKQYSETT